MKYDMRQMHVAFTGTVPLTSDEEGDLVRAARTLPHSAKFCSSLYRNVRRQSLMHTCNAAQTCAACRCSSTQRSCSLGQACWDRQCSSHSMTEQMRPTCQVMAAETSAGIAWANAGSTSLSPSSPALHRSVWRPGCLVRCMSRILHCRPQCQWCSRVDAQNVYANMTGNVLVHITAPALGLSSAQWSVVSWGQSQLARESVYDRKYIYRWGLSMVLAVDISVMATCNSCGQVQDADLRGVYICDRGCCLISYLENFVGFYSIEVSKCHLMLAGE